MAETEKGLLQWIIKDCADTLHEVGQKLFWQVEAKATSAGKVKPEFAESQVLKLKEAEHYIRKARDLLFTIEL